MYKYAGYDKCGNEECAKCKHMTKRVKCLGAMTTANVTICKECGGSYERLVVN